MVVGLMGCQTKPVQPVSDNGKLREASPIDPARPPKVSLQGWEEGQVLPTPELALSVTIENYPVGEAWQHAVIWINDSVSFKIYKPNESLVIREGLVPGFNLIRAYLVRSWGESLKFPDAFASRGVYLQRQNPGDSRWLRQPILTLVSPRGVYSGPDAKSLSFDFLVAGAALSPNGSKVVYSLNGEQRVLSAVDSYRFQNLKPGKYDLKLEVIDSRGKPYSSPFSKAFSSFIVE
jgi:hypothetical protein